MLQKIASKYLEKIAEDWGTIGQDLMAGTDYDSRAEKANEYTSRKWHLISNNPKLDRLWNSTKEYTDNFYGNSSGLPLAPYLGSQFEDYFRNNIGKFIKMVNAPRSILKSDFDRYKKEMGKPITDDTPISRFFTYGDYRKATPEMRDSMDKARNEDLRYIKR
jgi:hypothetical protein